MARREGGEQTRGQVNEGTKVRGRENERAMLRGG